MLWANCGTHPHTQHINIALQLMYLIALPGKMKDDSEMDLRIQWDDSNVAGG
jgi:hypothetical protein